MISKKSSTQPIMKKNFFEDLVFFVVDYPWNHPIEFIERIDSSFTDVIDRMGEKDDPSRNSNYVPFAIRAHVLY